MRPLVHGLLAMLIVAGSHYGLDYLDRRGKRSEMTRVRVEGARARLREARQQLRDLPAETRPGARGDYEQAVQRAAALLTRARQADTPLPPDPLPWWQRLAVAAAAGLVVFVVSNQWADRRRRPKQADSF